jgi:hypothetical protein
MNETSDTAGTPTDAQWRSLRNLVHCLAIAVLVLTATVGVFLFRQVVILRKNTTEMAVFLKRYEDSDFPEAIERVRQRLDDYRQKDPGFNPIYIRYFGSNPPARPLPVKAGTNDAAEAAR